MLCQSGGESRRDIRRQGVDAAANRVGEVCDPVFAFRRSADALDWVLGQLSRLGMVDLSGCVEIGVQNCFNTTVSQFLGLGVSGQHTPGSIVRRKR